jgi:leucyl-tRNA synthetase
MKKYDHRKIESAWQRKWQTDGTYSTKELFNNKNKSKFYVLDMFPYPSGEGLHVGHPKGYIATDIVSRYRRMKGDSVLHPIGFDAFGLPAENYAIKTKTNPEIAVKKNVARYKKQLEILGFDYDWSREVNTTDPAYYKWTQWIFLQLFKKGLAYESYEPINWCPKDKTGLANEDIENGRCERCGTPVEKKWLKQWVLKITDYADRLLTDLDAFDQTNIPVLVDKINPPKKGKKTVARRTVHAIVRDPRNGQVLCIKWRKFPWTGFPIGGVEDGEDVVEAARREVHEETGYKNLKFVRVMGGIVRGEYFAAHKDENRIAYSNVVLFDLDNDERDNVSGEELAKHEAIWLDPETLTHENFTCAELDVWKERLSAEVIWDKSTGVPCFVDQTKQSAVRVDQPFVERNAIMAIVKHWKEDKYIGLKWKKVNWQTIITGGVEGNDTPEAAAQKEIIEETGYENVKFKRNLGKNDSKFFHNPKGVNRHAHFDALYFELKDGKCRELTDEEKSNHEVVWLTKEEMSEFLSPASHRYVWDVLFRKMPNRFAETKPLLEWPESIKEAQRNWIGRSEGALITFGNIEVFTTRPDTIQGVTYIVLAPEHKLVSEFLSMAQNKDEIEAYISKTQRENEIERTDATREKTGVELKGVKVTNPANNEEVPVWIADYVLPDYGTGAVMAVPAHDERDAQFAQKFGLPSKKVVDGKAGIDEMRKITKSVGGKWVTKFKLRDWVFSRQRYWGEPIPVVHCARCAFKQFEKQVKVTISIDDQKKWKTIAKDAQSLDVGGNTVQRGDIVRVLNMKSAHELLLRIREHVKGTVWQVEQVTVPIGVSEKSLPVKLPKVKSYVPTGTGESPLAAISSWVNTKCPKCKGPAKRETNTMPQWAGSSWYYLRYEDPKNRMKLVDPKKEKYWSPVDLYVGGAEHATRHLIYARFWHKFLHDIKSVSRIEPFKKLQNVGLIMGEDGRKMSKRFGNVVNPDDIVKKYGADTLRLYEMFMGPFDQQIAWSTSGMVGSRRFIERVWNMGHKVAENKLQVGTGRNMQKAIKKVTEDIEGLRFNTAVSTLMIALNELEKQTEVTRGDYEALLKLLAPFAPHVVDELWMMVGNKGSIHTSPWPTYDAKLAIDEEATIMVQVNGKVRGSFSVARNTPKEELEKRAREVPGIDKWIGGQAVGKIVVVPNKLVNFVIISP